MRLAHGQADRRKRAQSGQMVVLFALTIVVVMGAAALAVGLTGLRTEAENAQRVANAAALAGVIFMPNYPANATHRALEEAAKNGFIDGQNGVSILTSSVPGFPSRLRVDVREPVTIFFGGVLGVGNRSISRSAVAEYFQPLGTGGPDTVLGYAPYPTKLVATPAPENFYLENKGPYSYKESGDAYSPLFESFLNPSNKGPFFAPPPGNDIPSGFNPCMDGGNPPKAVTSVNQTCIFSGNGTKTTPNGDNASTGGAGFEGYNYIVDDPVANTLVIKLFDPYDELAYNNLAVKYDGTTKFLAPDDASKMTFSNTDSTVKDSSGNCILGGTPGNCLGKLIDQRYGGTQFGAYPTTLQFRLYGPGISPTDPALPQIITATQGVTTTNQCISGPTPTDCVYDPSSATSSGFSAGSDPTPCDPIGKPPSCSSSPYAYRFMNYAIIHGPGVFRLNVRSVANSDGTEGTRGNAYGIAVCGLDPISTNNELGNTIDPYTNANNGWDPKSCVDPNAPANGGKCNNPAIPQPTDVCIHLYGLGKMAIHNWLSAGQSLVPLGYIPPEYAGKTLVVRLYDVGDVTPGAQASTIETLTPAGDLTHQDGSLNQATCPTCTTQYSSALPFGYTASPADSSSNNQGYCDSGSSPTNCPANPNSPPSPLVVTDKNGNHVYNGSWLTLTIPLTLQSPQTYSGMVADFGGYWKMIYNVAGSADDATTWSISIAGSPVHLVTQ